MRGAPSFIQALNRQKRRHWPTVPTNHIVQKATTSELSYQPTFNICNYRGAILNYRGASSNLTAWRSQISLENTAD